MRPALLDTALIDMDRHSMMKWFCDRLHLLPLVPLPSLSKRYRDGSYTLDWESGERKELRQPEARLKPLSSTHCCIPDTSASDCEGADAQPPGPIAATAASAGSPTLSELVSRDRTLAAEVLSSLGCAIPVEKILSVPRFLRIRASRRHHGDDARLPIGIDAIRNELRAAGG